MSSGIYLLNFNNQAYYVGQSQDIESRWQQHADKFAKNKSAKKMQDAYNAHGMPETSILLECHKDYLDIMENYYIAQQKTKPNCLNTTTPPLESNVDYDWLLQNTHMLKISSIDIINNFIETTKQKDELQVEYDTIKKQLESKFLTPQPSTLPTNFNDALMQHTQDKIAHIQSELARIKARSAQPPIV